MKPRRSKRLSKSPVVKDSDSDLESNGKKQKLEQVNSLSVDRLNKKSTLEKKVYRNYVDSLSKSSNVNGNDSDSSDSSDDYMKSPQTIDLNSDFFKVDFRKAESTDFAAIENKIFSNVQQLTDCEDSFDEDSKFPQNDLPIPLVFRQLAEAESSNKNLPKCDRKKGKSKHNNLSAAERSTRKKHKRGDTNSESKNFDKMDVSELLALGETQGSDVKKVELPSASEEELTDWEEVKEENKEVKQEHHSFPKDGVEITVEAPDIFHKRKKKGIDMAAFVKRRLNQIKREQQMFIHKVHLLCWVAHGIYVNTILNSEELMGLSLSLIPTQHSYPNKVDIKYLKQISGWFIKTVPVVEVTSDKNSFVPLLESLQQQFANATARSNRDLVLMFVCLLRSLGLTTRLIISIQPLPLKPVNAEDVKNVKGKQENKKLEKKKVEKKEIKVLSPDEARKLQKKVISKEEAFKRLKSSETERIMKPTTLKKPRVVEKLLKTSDKMQVNEEKPRRSFRQRNSVENKYKDASTSSDEEIIHGKKTVNSSDKNLSNKDEIKIVGRKSQDKSASQKSSIDDKLLMKNRANKSNESETKIAEKCSTPENIVSIKDESSSTSTLRENHDSSNMKKRVGSLRTKNISKTLKKDKVSGEKNSAPSISSEKSALTNKIEPNVRGKKSKLKPEINKDNRSTCTSQTSEDDFVPRSQNPKKNGGRTNCVEKEQNIKKRQPTKKSESESDFENELTTKIKQAKQTSSTKSEIDRRVLSTDSDDSCDNKSSKPKNDFWVEVLVDSEQWIPVDVMTGEVNCAEKLYKRATKPVCYIVAWNPDLSLKDITRKYCTQFHSVTRKQRVDENWWKEALFPFLSPHTARDKKEDEDMQKQIQELPRPTSIAEYKNHPLYALKRHLLKFQAIYPPNAPTLGFVRNEPVYARECVYTLHSREIWLKEAKVVRLGEQPYKVVKARPKWDRMNGKVITDLPLEIFGPWQVEDYVPPTATDGKVPRNAYGNVELFKPSMLPKGTVHLQVPGLNRVAKKLQIDCAPAVVGFDYHCGACHPTYDGFVVCEEFQDLILDAWNRDQEEAERRDQEKRDKRVYGNWRRLIKGLLIRERLKVKYAFGESEASTSKGKKGKKGKPVSKKLNEDEIDSD